MVIYPCKKRQSGQHYLHVLFDVRRRGRMHSDDPLFGKGKWQHDGFEALSKELDTHPVPMMW